MELIDRYLQAVGFWLPRKQEQDILAELSEDLRSQVEERANQLGRQLNQAEAEAMLKQVGSPIVVASRYLPPQHLIGPALFPIYKLVLKVAWLFCFVPWLVVWICLTSFVPGYRAGFPGTFIVGVLHGLWLSAVYTFACVTAVFGIVDKYKAGWLENWNPGKLPALRNPSRTKPSTLIVEIVALLIALFWWIGFMSSPVIVNRPELRILLAPTWLIYFWGIVALAIVTLMTACASLFRPEWTRLRATVRLITDGVGWALFAWLCTAKVVAQISIRDVAPERAMQIANAINLWMERSFPVVVAAGLMIVAVDVYRLVQRKREKGGCLGGLAAMVSS